MLSAMAALAYAALLCACAAGINAQMASLSRSEQAYESLLESALSEGGMGDSFTAFLHHTGKQYGEAERLHRLGVYTANVERIRAHNAAGKSAYTLGLNPYADLSTEEFRAAMFGAQPRDLLELRGPYSEPSDVSKHGADFPYGGETPPPAVDWRSKGVVGPIKNQHINGSSCGCCYAFGAVAGVEAANALYTGKVTTLSEQQIVDCDSYDYGCDGGDFTNVVKYVHKNGGIDDDSDYPYAAREEDCYRRKAGRHVVTVDGFVELPKNNQTALMQALAHTPTIVAVCCGDFLDQWHLYKGGIFDESAHCDKPLDHSVLVVGYGTGAEGDYFEIKNSWGAEWGMGGFMRLKRGVSDRHGQNGLATMPAYVLKTRPNTGGLSILGRRGEVAGGVQDTAAA